MTCFKFNSLYHFANMCDADYTAAALHVHTLHVDVVATEGVEHIVLVSGEMNEFTWEARGSAALASCCSLNVVGRIWLEMKGQYRPWMKRTGPRL